MVARLISSGKSNCLLIKQVDEASRVKGILNLECVLPPGRGGATARLGPPQNFKKLFCIMYKY